MCFTKVQQTTSNVSVPLTDLSLEEFKMGKQNKNIVLE